MLVLLCLLVLLMRITTEGRRWRRLLRPLALANRNLFFGATLPTFGVGVASRSLDLQRLQLLHLPLHPLQLHWRPPPVMVDMVLSQWPRRPLRLFKSRQPSWKKVRYSLSSLFELSYFSSAASICVF